MSQSPTVAAKLEAARSEVTKILQQLDALGPRVTEEPNGPLQDAYHEARARFTESSKALKTPRLRLATIGTTSAGKSTVVNAIVGRQVAPIDSDELSAGVLRVIDTPRNRLHIERSPDGLWEAVEQYDIADSAVYEYLREKVFKPYHAAKSTRTVQIPTATVEGPVLFSHWPELLGLPSGIGFEILDLPGLNSVQDADNLSIIQRELKRCVSLVVLDYCHTDRKSREKLLGEISHVTAMTGGRTDTVIFILNRVDRRTANDDPLEERISQLKNEIGARLKLSSPPELIPFQALPLFYAQCAWGPVSVHSVPSSNLSDRTTYWSNFKEDCLKLIIECQRRDPSKSSIFLKDSARELTADDLLAWVDLAWRYSGGLDLIDQLKQRISSHIAELVIGPSLSEAIASGSVLIHRMKESCKTRRISTAKHLEDESKRMGEMFRALETSIGNRATRFQSRMARVSEDLGAHQAERVAVAIKELFSGQSDGDAAAVRRVVRDTKEDLDEKILVPLRDYFLKGEASEWLREHYAGILPPKECTDLVQAAESYRAMGMTKNAARDGLLVTARDGAKDETDVLEGARQSAMTVYGRTRAALAKRGAFVLRTKASVLEKAIRAKINEEISGLEHDARRDLPEDAARSLLATFQTRQARMPEPSLPERMFDLPTFKPSTKIEQVPDGTREVIVESGTCFKDKETKNIPVTRDVNINRLELPAADQMRKDIYSAVEKSEASLWGIVGSWVKNSVDNVVNNFTVAAEESEEFLLAELNTQMARLTANKNERMEEIQRLDDLTDATKDTLDALIRLAEFSKL